MFHYFRPDGEKKAYVRLAPDYDALDVANKVSGFDLILVENLCYLLLWLSLILYL